MLQTIRTNSNNSEFIQLVNELDFYLASVNGDTNDFFVQHNKIDLINHVVIIYDNEIAVGCGAIKSFDENSMEIKRMFVPTTHRRKGIARKILDELTAWSKELGYKTCVLETSKTMTDAVELYSNYGFSIIPNYGQYQEIKSSVCFEKSL